jgi:hypothetical protein
MREVKKKLRENSVCNNQFADAGAISFAQIMTGNTGLQTLQCVFLFITQEIWKSQLNFKQYSKALPLRIFNICVRDAIY